VLLQRPVRVDADQLKVRADVLAADAARVAAPAGRERPDRDPVADRETRPAARADCLDDPGDLVPLHARVERLRVFDRADVAVEVVEVGPAETDRLRAHEDLARARPVRLGPVDDLHHSPGLGYSGAHGRTSSTRCNDYRGVRRG